MKVFCFGNCQIGALAHALERCFDTLSVRYLPNYQSIEVNCSQIDDELCSAINDSDLVVMQPLSSKWGIYSELPSYLSLLGKPYAILPFIYLDGLWPVYMAGTETIGVPSCLLTYLSRSLTPKTLSLDAILDAVVYLEADMNDFDIYNVRTRFHLSLSLLRFVESNFKTIPITPFLSRSYQSSRIMLTQNHPSALLTCYCMYKVISHFAALNILPPSLVEAARLFFCQSYTFPPDSFIGGPYPMSLFVHNILDVNIHVSPAENFLAQRFTSQYVYRLLSSTLS